MGIAMLTKPYWTPTSRQVAGDVAVIDEPNVTPGENTTTVVARAEQPSRRDYLSLIDALGKASTTGGLVSCSTQFKPYLSQIELARHATEYEIQQIRYYRHYAEEHPQARGQAEDVIRVNVASMISKLSGIAHGGQETANAFMTFCPRAVREMESAEALVDPSSEEHGLLQSCVIEVRAIMAEDAEISAPALQRDDSLGDCDQVTDIAQITKFGV